MQDVHEILLVLSAVAIGVWAGALIAEGSVLVPYWRSLSADRFYEHYKQLHPKLYRFFTPATVTPLLFSLALGVVSFLVLDNRSWFHAVVFLLCLAATVSHEIYFNRVNTEFASGPLSQERLSGELRRWAIWHWARTVLVVLAFGATLLSLKS